MTCGHFWRVTVIAFSKFNLGLRVMKSRKGEGNKTLHCEERKTFLTLVWSLCFGPRATKLRKCKKTTPELNLRWAESFQQLKRFFFFQWNLEIVYILPLLHICLSQSSLFPWYVFGYFRLHLNCPSGTVKIYSMTTNTTCFTTLFLHSIQSETVSC